MTEVSLAKTTQPKEEENEEVEIEKISTAEIKQEVKQEELKKEELIETRKKRVLKEETGQRDDDLEKMLKWRKGVGHLPGSTLKFRKSAKGELEVITPDSDDEETVVINTKTDENGKRQRKRKPAPKSYHSLEPYAVKQDECSASPKRKRTKKRPIDSGEVLKCETCACAGLITEFRSSGRFCSQRCVGAYASKRRAEMIADQTAKGERGMQKKSTAKKGKKEDSEENSLNDLPIEDDSVLYYEKYGYKKDFEWEEYLKVTKSKAVPLETFLREFDSQEAFPLNKFCSGMKLECVDPKHQALICVTTIVDVQGSRMRLHFDGWSEYYDFWLHSDSYFLHPCGWCEENNQKLTPPKGMKTNFNWSEYLHQTQSDAAPDHLFPVIGPPSHGFEVGMKLEAIDRKNPDLVCVASVTNVIGEHFLVHFDEWDDQYDYWARGDSPYIHHVGWCEEIGITLIPPTDEMINKFIWKDYLDETNTKPATKEFFNPRDEPNFIVGQKLEVGDPRNHSLVRVATVAESEDFRVKIHFDGWDSIYDTWFDTDSTELHPVTWCQKTGHILEPPRSGQEKSSQCGTVGCRGVGHIKGAKYTSRHTSYECPYTLSNLNRDTSPVVNRLIQNDGTEAESAENTKQSSEKSDVLPDSTTNIATKRPVKRKKRKGSDEVTSSTHSTLNLDTLVKPLPSTHIPANKKFQSKALPWDQDDVSTFLNAIGYQHLISQFKENEIDGQALLLLSQADMVRHLKLKLGPALKIYSEISKL